MSDEIRKKIPALCYGPHVDAVKVNFISALTPPDKALDC
jgi:hypothetical protein